MSNSAEQDVFHLIDWAGVRQRRVYHSSYGAEILACTGVDDIGYNLMIGMSSIFRKQNFYALVKS